MVGPTKPRLVFLCVHNAGRSQMAAAFALDLGEGRVEVFSGGSDPAEAVNPTVVQAMDESGIDLKDRTPRAWTVELLESADVVVTMGCGDTCPVVPGVRYLDWELKDPSCQPLAEVRAIRDEIRDRVAVLIEGLI